MAQKDGGLAFPAEYAGVSAQGAEITITHPGMSLRDYFAAVALQGIIAHDGTVANSSHAQSAYNAAQVYRSYELADAMLVERERFRS